MNVIKKVKITVLKTAFYEELAKDQKNHMVKEFTTIAAKVMNVPERAFVVIIKENEQDNIGSGGKLLSDII